MPSFEIGDKVRDRANLGGVIVGMMLNLFGVSLLVRWNNGHVGWTGTKHLEKDGGTVSSLAPTGESK